VDNPRWKNRTPGNYLPHVTRDVESYIAGLRPAQARVVRELGRLILEAAPDAALSIKSSQPVWEMSGPVCSARAFERYTNVNFWRSAELAEHGDPDQLLQGEGGKMRHIRIASVDDIRPAALIQLVRSAADLNRRFGDPTKATDSQTGRYSSGGGQPPTQARRTDHPPESDSLQASS
jgi:hypothetical protein